MNAEFDFDKMSGLLPAVVQDSARRGSLDGGIYESSGAAANAREGLRDILQPHATAALDEGRKFGKPAEGHLGHTDCDRDTLLLRVEVEGAGVVCHRGTRSCFTEPVLMGCGTACKIAGGSTR